LRNATLLPAPRAARRASRAAARVSTLLLHARRFVLQFCLSGCPIFARMFQAKVGLSISLLLLAAAPAFPQATPPPEPDPLARIRAQPPAQVCSEAQPTLCAEAAPKIIANAMGSDSTIEKNLGVLASGEGGHAMGAPAPQSVVDETRAVDWAVAAFRAAGLDVHTELVPVPFNFQRPEDAAPEIVVAEIRGREKPAEIVILGARVDSGVLRGNGTSDDACDAAVVIEAARDIIATGLVPRRTIRFVLFPGGNSWATGSWSYVQAHRDEMDHTIAAILIGTGRTHLSAYSLGARHDTEPGVRDAVAPLGSLGAPVDRFDLGIHRDDFAFFLEGVPTLAAEGESIGAALPDLPDMTRNAAIVGVTAFDLAEAVAPLGPRLSHQDIEALLKQSGLDEQMKKTGFWYEWETGQVGRQP